MYLTKNTIFPFFIYVLIRASLRKNILLLPNTTFHNLSQYISCTFYSKLT